MKAAEGKYGVWYYLLTLPVSSLFAFSGVSDIAVLLNFYAIIVMVMIGV